MRYGNGLRYGNYYQSEYTSGYNTNNRVNIQVGIIPIIG